jgi:hypothetical protein
VTWPAYEETSVGVRSKVTIDLATIKTDPEQRRRLDHATALARAVLLDEPHPPTTDVRDTSAPPARAPGRDTRRRAAHRGAPVEHHSRSAGPHQADRRLPPGVPVPRDPEGSVINMGVELTHSQAKNRLLDITEEIERLGAKDDLTNEDEVRFAALNAEFDEVDKHRKGLERAAAVARVQAAAEGVRGGRVEDGAPRASGDGYDRDAILEPDSIEDHRFRNPWDLTDVRSFGRSPEDLAEELRSRALSAIEKMPSANDKVREAATHIVERFDDKESTIARMVLAASSPVYLRAWAKMATNRQHLLTDDEKRAMDAGAAR